MQDYDQPLFHDLTEIVLGCCFDVMNELGIGFLETVYRNALLISLRDKGLKVDVEKRFEVVFKERKIGVYIADLVVEGKLILELKCCESLVGEHQAQLINYLKASNILVGLLINFRKRRLEYKRVHHPDYHAVCDPAYLV
ncbi:MAG: GxxExxY protein [Chlamydiia bacterium]|nr:GxxExxY protein [Chlamydiia bacterium]